jgi:3-deoxy-manno-octulosonate cytidylyltransferase (CMP-KDO synthetase)
MSGRCFCVIPARMGASRFPGKPLAKVLGLAMISHVEKRCRLYEGFQQVVVATCDEEIQATVQGSGGRAVMTSDKHERATDRVAEAVTKLGQTLDPDDLVVMVQGDEIMVTPEMLADVVADHMESGAVVVNLVSRLYSTEDQNDPNTVKIVADPNGNALLFSRAPIPSRSRMPDTPVYQQTGIISFRREFLTKFSELPQTPLEIIESIDMLRVIENRLPLRVVWTETETIGVDTPDELRRAEQKLKNDPVTSRYTNTP